MVNFICHAYLIECLSNLHAGSGDNNYAVIDKEVQRDPISPLPVIHASGLKGALREYFDRAVRLAPEKVTRIFGSGKEEGNKLKQGAYRFFEARLLSMPVRSAGDGDFYRAISSNLVQEHLKLAEKLGSQLKIEVSGEGGRVVETEFGPAQFTGSHSLIGEKTVILPHEAMLQLLKQLPLMARNSLENGQSENLWYEEVVPRESRYIFFVAVPDAQDAGLDFEEDFNQYLHKKTVQIGANATVGYGYCRITKTEAL